MSLKTTIESARDTHLKNARSNADDARRLICDRAMLTAIANAEVHGNTRVELDESATIDVLRKLVKQRTDAVTAYNDAAQPIRAADEQFEADYIATYLPTLLDEAQTLILIESIVDELGLTGPFQPKQLGMVMGKLKDNKSVDKKLASTLAKTVIEERA